MATSPCHVVVVVQPLPIVIRSQKRHAFCKSFTLLIGEQVTIGNCRLFIACFCCVHLVVIWWQPATGNRQVVIITFFLCFLCCLLFIVNSYIFLVFSVNQRRFQLSIGFGFRIYNSRQQYVSLGN